ncbi:MAG: hypothetical protein OXK80_00280, partial [Bdellovibrionales bacterium]|nr:hypothetical protein [Bdellovibrionales bacterium]
AELDYAREKGLSEGRKEGIAQGMAEGIAKGITEGKAKGKAEGRAEGRGEGLEEGMKLVAVNMIKNKMDIELIVKITGLSKTKILKLKKNLK